MQESYLEVWTSQVVLVVKNLPANTGDIRDAGLIPGLGRSRGGGHGNPLQYSCLENPMDRGAWRATVHRVAKSQTRLKQHSTRAHLRAQRVPSPVSPHPLSIRQTPTFTPRNSLHQEMAHKAGKKNRETWNF